MHIAAGICTDDRAASPAETLSALRGQVASDGLKPVVVNSSFRDEARAGVVGPAQCFPLRARRVLEPTQCLSHAHSRGPGDASARVVLFIDDDASPVDAYRAGRVGSAFASGHVGAVAGDAIGA
jgi:hypothetical protein